MRRERHDFGGEYAVYMMAESAPESPAKTGLPARVAEARKTLTPRRSPPIRPPLPGWT